jgi:hypothetical protein
MARITLFATLLTAFLFSCNNVVKQTASEVHLPKPYASSSVLNFAQVIGIGWPKGQTPTVPKGFYIF